MMENQKVPENLLNKEDVKKLIRRNSAYFKPIIRSLMYLNNQINQHNGWNDKPIVRGEQLANIHGEVSECWEWIRKGHSSPSDHIPGYTGEEEELADVIIRIMHYAERLRLRLGGAIIAKLLYNIDRTYRHGGKVV